MKPREKANLKAIKNALCRVDDDLAKIFIEAVSSLPSEERRETMDRIGDKWKLARFMHEKYERYAFIFGWNTQEKTKVPFAELPEENKKTMLAVADDIINLIKQRDNQ